MSLHTFVFSLFVLLLWSCEASYDVVLPASTPKLVVNSLFCPDSTWRVAVSRTISVFDTALTAPPIENASVLLFDNETLIDTLTHTQNGVYTLAAYPEVGKTYTLKVSADGYTSITASSSIPQSATMVSGTFDTITVTDINELLIPYQAFPLSLIWKDNANNADFYRLELALYDSIYLDSNTTRYPHLFQFEELSSKDPHIQSSEAGFLLLDDVAFNGGEKLLNCTVFSLLFYGNIINYDNGVFATPRKRLEIYFWLKTLSSDLYLYEKSYVKNQMSHVSPLSEHINAYSNIVGGLGIFGGYSNAMLRIY